jgi:hypothetical protein
MINMPIPDDFYYVLKKEADEFLDELEGEIDADLVCTVIDSDLNKMMIICDDDKEVKTMLSFHKRESLEKIKEDKINNLDSSEITFRTNSRDFFKPILENIISYLATMPSVYPIVIQASNKEHFELKRLTVDHSQKKIIFEI